MTTDGGLRQLFRKHIPGADWQSVETWSTGQGVPDLNYCLDGVEGWIELKQTDANVVDIRPEQIAWAERRTRAGGRVLLAVRRKHGGGPRKGPPVDELWMFNAQQMRSVQTTGLRTMGALIIGMGGPTQWSWSNVMKLMKDPLAFQSRS
jgi:hypothetical protein